MLVDSWSRSTRFRSSMTLVCVCVRFVSFLQQPFHVIVTRLMTLVNCWIFLACFASRSPSASLCFSFLLPCQTWMLSILRERFRLHARLSRIGRPKFKMKCWVGRRNAHRQLGYSSLVSCRFQFVPVPHFETIVSGITLSKGHLFALFCLVRRVRPISNLRRATHFSLKRRLSKIALPILDNVAQTKTKTVMSWNRFVGEAYIALAGLQVKQGSRSLSSH